MKFDTLVDTRNYYKQDSVIPSLRKNNMEKNAYLQFLGP
jgi:hypothetical protein